MVQDLEDMKVSVRGQHHAQLQEACAGQITPFSFNLGYLILGICYLLCDLTLCKCFYLILNQWNTIKFIVFHWVMKSSGFANLTKCSMVLLPLYGAFGRSGATSRFAGKPDVRLSK